MKKKILFISSVNLSTNPRILKEIKLAHGLNYDIGFLGFYLGNWSDMLDKNLLREFSWLSPVYLDATRKNFTRWLRHSMQERLNRVIWKLRKDNLFLASTASTKRSFALIDYGRTIKPGSFDLIVGHTLAAFYPAFLMARKAGCPCAFDMEDYHPGEHIDADSKNEMRRRELIMQHVLPAGLYISASSPLISFYTQALCKLDEKKMIPVLNFFSSEEFKAPAVGKSKKIRLIWFSQFIGRGRGLEIILTEWKELAEDFELTLVGSVDQTFTEVFQDGIQILSPLPQVKLHELLGAYDAGLAFDLTSRDFNRDIALTNKILAYYQAGLYILATDTAAQRDFMQQYPGSGMLFLQNNRSSFLASLQYVRENIVAIRSGSGKRYQDASVNSWENESCKLKRAWEEGMK